MRSRRQIGAAVVGRNVVLVRQFRLFLVQAARRRDGAGIDRVVQSLLLDDGGIAVRVFRLGRRQRRAELGFDRQMGRIRFVRFEVRFDLRLDGVGGHGGCIAARRG